MASLLNQLSTNYTPLDLSDDGPNGHLDPALQDDFESGLQYVLQGRIGVGGYLEKRRLYERSSQFNSRNIHLGIDFWTAAGTEIYSITDYAVVWSITDNEGIGDYGPTIILEHKENSIASYSLYGHLSRSSLSRLHIGQVIKKGDTLGFIGHHHENGNWSPHLHFQLIKSLSDNSGDFPGVCSGNDLEHFKALCPNPNLILQLPDLS